MPYDTSKLPVPPEFPPSNASYNKIVGKMHKVALNATTAEAAIAAVHSIQKHMKGTNTYAKATRRYGDKLIAEIAAAILQPVYAINEGTNSESEPAQAKAKAEKPAIPMTVETAKGPIEVDLKKLETQPFTSRTFANKSNAKRALKSAGCDHFPVQFVAFEDGVKPILQVSDDKAVAYANERGFAAKVTA